MLIFCGYLFLIAQVERRVCAECAILHESATEFLSQNELKALAVPTE